MAYSIRDNVIIMTRGDTLIAPVSIYNANQPYTPASGDVIRFALKHNRFNKQFTEFEDTNPVLTKVIPTDTLVLRLDPNDTKSLGFGEYIYEVEITKTDGTVDTFIPASKFILAPEVY